ncbi:MAG: permease [Deferrisomatales bacterium]|nr:permease [Deferrisomatales bacterium]
MKEREKLLLIVGVFLAAYYVPVEHARVQGALLESFRMLQDYARAHVLTCLVPAFFIAGAIAVFVSQGAVLRYLGAGAQRVLAYSVASVSGGVLAVCSCTVLPLFAGIYNRGAGIGPAAAFLYSGPAINVLAIVMTAKVLGPHLGVARAVGAVVFAVVVGLLMAVTFRRSEAERQAGFAALPEEEPARPLWKNALYMLAMVAVLVFGAWGEPRQPVGWAMAVFDLKWYLSGAGLVATLAMVWVWFSRDERVEWVEATWGFAKQILPLLLAGVLIAGFLLGMPGSDAGLIPSEWVAKLVGGNSLGANLFASVAGALMYFATLTEVPILQGLLGSGMGSGPALALLLAGPALSLPNMLVIQSVLGTRKTAVFIGYVVLLSTAAGMIFGNLFPHLTLPGV